MVAIALLGAIACGGSSSDSTTGPANDNPVGIYSLRQVNGKPIPTEVFRGTSYDPDLDVVLDPLVIKVTGGEVILSDNGTFHIAVDVAYIANGGEDHWSDTGDGVYEITGNTIAFQGAGGTITGTLQRGDITLDVNAQGKTRRYLFRYVP